MDNFSEDGERVHPGKYIVVYPFYWCLFGSVLVVAGLGLYALLESVEESEFTRMTGALVLGAMVAWFFICMPWLTHRATKAHVGRFRPLLAAAGDAINEGRVLLSFLPIVGPWLAPPFRDEEEHETVQQP